MLLDAQEHAVVDREAAAVAGQPISVLLHLAAGLAANAPGRKGACGW